MSDVTLTKTRLFEGVWHGVLTSDQPHPPKVEAVHLDQRLEGVALERDGDSARYFLRVPVPVAAISDGVQAVVIRDVTSGETLASFAILAGETTEGDLRGEVSLLREELDLLKRAFRRHCTETL